MFTEAYQRFVQRSYANSSNVTAVALLWPSLCSALLRSSMNEPWAGQRCFYLWGVISDSSESMQVDPKSGELRTERNFRFVVRNKLHVTFHSRPSLTLSSVQGSFYTAPSTDEDDMRCY